MFFLSKINKVFKRLLPIFYGRYYGFIQGHTDLTRLELINIRSLVGKEADDVVREYQDEFAKIVGNGAAISFASARMGFFSLLRHIKVGLGDEVILPASTCAVMVNAILRTGATPLFADIDPNTFGSSLEGIKSRVSSRTKLIVAQHSFGIPCVIEPIVHFCKTNNIFLLEDCALTLGSKINNEAVGNFGDASLFSTDHSKPINTLTGGIIYSKNADLIQGLADAQRALPNLSPAKQNALWEQFLWESFFCRPKRYAFFLLLRPIISIFSEIKKTPRPFLDEDSNIKFSTTYPYPARMPAFLAFVGLLQCRKWGDLACIRKRNLMSFIKFSEDHNLNIVPSAYYSNKSVEIVPLRVVWTSKNGVYVRNKLSKIINTAWIWFTAPIVATNLPLIDWGYIENSCPISEKNGAEIINLPANLDEVDFIELLKRLKKVLCEA